MKIVITESQFKGIVSESYVENYLNHLLDKINKSGMDSLNDQEKGDLVSISNGTFDEEKPSSVKSDVYNNDPSFDRAISTDYLNNDPEDNFDSTLDPFQLFMHYAPEFEEIKVDDDVWNVQVSDGNGNEHLHVAKDDTQFYIKPFFEGLQGISVETDNGDVKKFKLQNTPKDKKEMYIFIQRFYKALLPHIIKKMVH